MDALDCKPSPLLHIKTWQPSSKIPMGSWVLSPSEISDPSPHENSLRLNSLKKSQKKMLCL